MGLVKFVTGTQSQFASLGTKDQDTLYIITDARQIYKGDICLSGGIYKTVASFPGTGEVNTLYVNTATGQVSYWNGSGYQTVVPATGKSISGAGDDTHLATTKAVVDYVASKLTDLDVGALEGRVSTLEGEMDTAQADIIAAKGNITTIQGQITTINGTGAGSITKALNDAKAYTDSVAATKANVEHDHTLSDITDAGTLAGLNEVAEGNLATALAAKINGKADKSTTLAGYGIGDAYTKGQTDSAIASAVAAAPHLKRTIVESLPKVGAADQNTIYMVGTGAGSEDSAYEEYMVINGAFERIGSSDVDLTNYALKSDITTAINNLDKADSAVANQYVSSVSQENGVITVARQTLPVRSVTEGTANGTILVNGSAVNVHGLGSAAYTPSSNYATAAQGTKADSALQKADITSGSANGTISVDGSDVSVKGLDTAAYAATSAFDAAGKADGALASAKSYAESLLTWGTL